MTSLSAIAVLTLAAGLAQLCTRHLGALVGLSVVQGLAVVLALLVDAWFGAAAVVLVLSVVLVALLFAWLPALHAAPAAVSLLPTSQLRIDVTRQERQPCRHAFNEREERGTV